MRWAYATSPIDYRPGWAVRETLACIASSVRSGLIGGGVSVPAADVLQDVSALSEVSYSRHGQLEWMHTLHSVLLVHFQICVGLANVLIKRILIRLRIGSLFLLR